MNEIRFSPYNKNVQNENAQTQATQNESLGRQKNPPRMKNVLKVLLFLLILACVVYAGVYFWKNKTSAVYHDVTASEYYAVFLTNGQVYFGKPFKKNRDELILSDVYYLKASGNTDTTQEQLTEPRFSLVKLGDEIHGPTDKLFINSDNILFYEQLKNDSKVVESILKNQNSQ